VQVKAGKQTHELMTDRRGLLFLNLLDGPLADQDLTHVNKLIVSVEDPKDGTRQEVTLTVSKALRNKLQEAHELIFTNLEDDDASQWAYRVNRLAQLGMEDEASELEQSLLELTRNDPELQSEFLQALKQKTGRQPARADTTP
jgi:hypothetical protein